jgi:hypothetical protein
VKADEQSAKPADDGAGGPSASAVGVRHSARRTSRHVFESPFPRNDRYAQWPLTARSATHGEV